MGKLQMIPTVLLLIILLITNHLTMPAMAAVGIGMEVEVEMEMESETSKRQLWAAVTTSKRYISYDALKGDVVPCSKPGAPYYNCRALPKANPYTRGCGIITGCARDMNP